MRSVVHRDILQVYCHPQDNGFIAGHPGKYILSGLEIETCGKYFELPTPGNRSEGEHARPLVHQPTYRQNMGEPRHNSKVEQGTHKLYIFIITEESKPIQYESI